MRSVLRGALGRMGWGIGLALGLAGCRGDTVKPYEPVTDPAVLYYALVLNYGAVNLSLAPGYEAFQLTATPINGMGAPITGLPAPTFQSTDTTRVKVSPTGLMTALKTGASVKVIAELTTSDNVKHVDTAFVNVNATTTPPPALATLTIDPVAPDSSLWPIPAYGYTDLGISLAFVWAPLSFPAAPTLSKYLKALTVGGTAITGLQAEYFSLDSAVATVNRRTGAVKMIRPGPVGMIARTVAYGVASADTTVFTVTPPIYHVVSMLANPTKVFPAVVIRQSGYVYWANAWRPVDVVFDNPAAVSISPSDTVCKIATTTGLFGPDLHACDADFALDTALANRYRIRKFTIPGTYAYRDTLSGESGEVLVLDSTAWIGQ